MIADPDNQSTPHHHRIAGHDGEPPPARPQRRHLRRLERIFDAARAPLFFLTVNVRDRANCLAVKEAADVLVDAWGDAREVHAWLVGRYVVMPDHVHFFVAPGETRNPSPPSSANGSSGRSEDFDKLSSLRSPGSGSSLSPDA